MQLCTSANPRERLAHMLWEFLTSPKFGAVANLIGIAGTVGGLIGLAFTYRVARNSRSAAEQARDAVEEMNLRTHQVDIAAELSTATTAMEELLRLQRMGRWEIALERHNQVRKALIRTKAAGYSFTQIELALLQLAITKITDMSDQIEKLHMSDPSKLRIASYNRILKSQMDSLNEVALSVRSSLTR